MNSMIEIDGSEGEGGGQILRTGVALSALTQQEVKIGNIRANRPTPGLAAQHLCAVRGVAAICNAVLEGDEVGSTELIFRPKRIEGGKHRLEVGTAGSITLVLQACLLAACGSKQAIELDITGGTNVRWSPPIDFYREMLFPLLSSLGMHNEIRAVIRGFYPEGGGRVEVRLSPFSGLRPLVLLERGALVSIAATCFSQNLPDHICQRMGSAVRKAFPDQKVSSEVQSGRGASTGAGCFLLARYDGAVLSADGLGERGMPAEKVAENAVWALQHEMRSSATLDLHAADQLLPYLALAKGPSSFVVSEMSGHLRTQMDLVKRFLPVQIGMEKLKGGLRIDVQPQPYM